MNVTVKNFKTQRVIFELYQQELGREPDDKGFDFWVNAVDQGFVTFVDVKNAFKAAASSE